jgi:hypothetical protein
MAGPPIFSFSPAAYPIAALSDKPTSLGEAAGGRNYLTGSNVMAMLAFVGMRVRRRVG